MSRHKERTTWETQGGHIEAGETPLEAAKRELFEESGAVDFDIEPICDYRAWDENTLHGANGVVFHAVIRQFSDIPESEMAERKAFSSLPDNLTYLPLRLCCFNSCLIVNCNSCQQEHIQKEHSAKAPDGAISSGAFVNIR